MHNAVHINNGTLAKDDISLIVDNCLRFEKEASRASCQTLVVGGGTGASMSIRVLLSLGVKVNALVAMADDGNSTGKLRELANATAPGDVRKCLLALACNERDPLSRVFSYRFSCANNHTLGNLILSSLEEETGSFMQALSVCEQLLNTQGHVYPSTLDHVCLCAQTKTGEFIKGQVNANDSQNALSRVWLENETCSHPVQACEEGLKAIEQADFIVLGPGSLFTSILANLAVPGIVEALNSSKAKIVFVASICDAPGETCGFRAYDEVQTLFNHGLQHLDYLLVQKATTVSPENKTYCLPVQNLASCDAVVSHEEATDFSAFDKNFFDGCLGKSEDKQCYLTLSCEEKVQLEEKGITVIERDFRFDNHPLWHNPVQLQSALREVIDSCLSQTM